MYNLTFSKNDFELTIMRCNSILRELAKVEEEDSHE